MKIKTLWIIPALAGIMMIPIGAMAYPGETGREMINRLGEPASGYEASTIRKEESVSQKTPGPIRTHWMNLDYDPLQTDQIIQGVLVAILEFDSTIPSDPGSKERGNTEKPISWMDLHSQREVFLAQISSGQFTIFKKALDKKWIIQSVTRHKNPQREYDLYVLQSRDGRHRAKISYSDSESIKEIPWPADTPKPPKLNLWVLVDRINP